METDILLIMMVSTFFVIYLYIFLAEGFLLVLDRAMTIISVGLGRTFHYVDEILPFRYCSREFHVI